MKKANREALRIALFDFQEERRLFLEQVRILMGNEMNAYGIVNEEYSPKKYVSPESENAVKSVTGVQ